MAQGADESDGGDRRGDLSIEYACGKVPLWAHRDGGMRRSVFLFFSGALLKVFSVDALPLVRKGTKGGGLSDEGAKGSLRSYRGLGWRKNLIYEECLHP